MENTPVKLRMKCWRSHIIRAFTAMEEETARYKAKEMARCPTSTEVEEMLVGRCSTFEGLSPAVRKHMMIRWWEMVELAVGVHKVTRRRCDILLLALVLLTTQRRVR